MGLLLTALALAVRLLWVLVVPTRPVGDFAMYLESARYLVEHHGLDPEFIYMPGYVYLAASLLDQDVLQVSSGDTAVGVPMRCVFALTAMGFIPESPGAEEIVRVLNKVF